MRLCNQENMRLKVKANPSMKKSSILVPVVLAALSATGVTSREFIKAAFSEVKVTFEENIPLSIDLARLREIIKTLDNEIAKGRRTLVETSLKLEKDEQTLVTAQKSLRSEQIEMLAIRNRLPGGIDGCVGEGVTALAGKLQRMMDAYKVKQAQIERLSESIKALKAAHAELSEQIQARVEKREELASRLNQIHTRKTTLELQAGGVGKLPSEDTLNRGEELANRIEDKLEVGSRLLKPILPALGNSSKDDVSPDGVTKEFDKIFVDSTGKISSR
jgi:hypothetical protein